MADVGCGRRGLLRLPLLLLALLAGCAVPEGPTGCVMRQVADLPVLNDRGVPIVRAAINDVPVAFIVDTGARASAIGQREAERLQLPVSLDNHYLVTGIGGSTFAGDVQVRRLSLGNTVARDISFMAVGRFGGSVDGLPVVGLFGADFLVNYNVEFDLPSHRLALYTEQHCGDHIRPWAGSFFEQPFRLTNETEIRFDITVNGRPIDAQLDSGAGATVLDSDDGVAAGATTATTASDRRTVSRGVDGTPVVGHLHRFDSIAIGPEHFGPAVLNVADTGGHTLLGADFLRHHRVWVSYPHEMIYAVAVRRLPVAGMVPDMATPKPGLSSPEPVAAAPAGAPVPGR